MPVRIGVPRERAAGETRVALVPESVAVLAKAGMEVVVEEGAGERAGYPDSEYAEKGARIERSAWDAAVVAKVRPPEAEEVEKVPGGCVLIGMLDPFGHAKLLAKLAARGVTCLALEFLPRITRAQPMDVLSSMSTVAGYRAVVLAAAHLPRFFPLLMTAAGTLSPAKVLVIGAGVAGLQAIATARRLGAVVEGYDIRPAVKEQVESLGARFVELPLEAPDAQDRSGYARAQSEEFYRRQQELLERHVAASDAVIATALVPGKKAPVLIPKSAVERMRPGSVIVDLAAEQGGNCELTEPGRIVRKGGVTVCGELNLPAQVPFHASQMYSRNITAYLKHIVRDSGVKLDDRDELVRGPLVTRAGEIVNELVRERA